MDTFISSFMLDKTGRGLLSPSPYGIPASLTGPRDQMDANTENGHCSLLASASGIQTLPTSTSNHICIGQKPTTVTGGAPPCTMVCLTLTPHFVCVCGLQSTHQAQS